MASGTLRFGFSISLPSGTMNSEPMKSQKAVVSSGMMSPTSVLSTAGCSTCSPVPRPSAPMRPSAKSDTTMKDAMIICSRVDIVTPRRLMAMSAMVSVTL